MPRVRRQIVVTALSQRSRQFGLPRLDLWGVRPLTYCSDRQCFQGLLRLALERRQAHRTGRVARQCSRFTRRADV
jgi:hypothetical protein